MRQRTSIIKIYFTLFIIFFLTGCGGGSSENKSTTPVTKSPQYSLIKPNYTGLPSKFEIAPFDAPKVILEITSGLDLLSSLIYGETNHQTPIFPFESSNNTGVDIACSSGSEETIEVVKDKHLIVKYDNCVKEGVKLNGTTDVHIIELIPESVLHEMDIISNLSITDLANNGSLSMSGYIKIRKSLSDGTFSSSIQFLLEDNEKQIYFDDFSLKETNNFNQLIYKGDVYLSNYGLISINTLDMSNKSKVMEIASTNSFAIDIALQETISFTFNNETTPVTIDLSNIPDTVWNNINESPTAKITVDAINGERYTTFEISSFESSDPDLEPLYYSWSIISKPIDSIATISQESTSSFVSDLPGDYTVQLSVTDSAGNTNIVTEGFYVAKGSPIVAINESATSLFIDEEYSAVISHSNDQYDAPIYYRLAYGPAGMTVDSSGQISWTSHVPDFSQTLEVNFAIDAFNTDKITTLERTLLVESLHKNVVHTLLTPYELTQNADTMPVFDLVMNNQIAEFTGDNVTVYKNYIYDPSRKGTFTKNGNSDISIITDNGIGYNYDEVIGTSSVNDELYYYAVGGSNDAPYIAKYGKTGNLIWQTSVQGSFDNYVLENFQVQGNAVLISASHDMLILNDTNGIVYQQNHSSGGISTSFMSPSNFDETLIVDTYNKKVLTVKNNELVVLYDASESNWGIGNANVEKIDFMQFDGDPQIEIVIYPYSDNKYYILDSISWEIEEFPAFTYGTMSVYSLYFSNSDSVCFNHDLKCRNTLLRAETISMVDKLSGKLVWSAPISIGQASNIKFYTHPNSHIATAIGGVGLKIFD